MSRGGPPEALNDRHMLAAHMVVQGKSAREIADKLGYNLNRVYLIKRSPAFQAKVAEIRAEVEERLLADTVDLYAAFDAEAPYALQTLKELHRDRSKNESVRRQAAVDILERAPSAPKKRRAIPVTLYWHMADDADVYLNGSPLREYSPSFKTRGDEAPLPAFSTAACLRTDSFLLRSRWSSFRVCNANGASASNAA